MNRLLYVLAAPMILLAVQAAGSVEQMKWSSRQSEADCYISGLSQKNMINIFDTKRDSGTAVEFALEILNTLDDMNAVPARVSIDGLYWNIEGDISIESFFWPNVPKEFIDALSEGKRLTVAIDRFEPITFSLDGTAKAVSGFSRCYRP